MRGAIPIGIALTTALACCSTAVRREIDEKRALELATAGLRGAVLESEDELREIVAMYTRRGIRAPLSSASRVYGTELSPLESGHELRFTAFLIGQGMGASASVARLAVELTSAGEAREVERTTYLSGPVLNWQTINDGTEIAARNAESAQREMDRRRMLVEEVVASIARKRRF